MLLASVLAAECLVDALPQDRIAGAHTFAADPRYSLVAEAAADLHLLTAEPEALLSVQPDLVIADPYTRPETLSILMQANVPVIQPKNPSSFADVEANLRRLGRVTHTEAAAETKVQAMQQALRTVREGSDGLSEWRVITLDGALHTHGEGSLFDLVVRTAGASNAAIGHDVGLFRKLDIEEVLAWQPDAIVVSSPDGNVPAWLEQFPGLEVLECVKKKRFVLVPTALLSTTSHRLVEVAATIQKQLKEWGRP